MKETFAWPVPLGLCPEAAELKKLGLDNRCKSLPKSVIRKNCEKETA